MNEVIQGDCAEIMSGFPEGRFDLAICDPPYFKTIGEKWDYAWRTESDYVEWSKMWIGEISRVIRLGGTLYIFGYFNILALLLPVFNNAGFSFRQQIIIDKGLKACAGRATKNYKMFPHVSESLLFLIRDNIPFTRKFLKERQKKLGLSALEINRALGVKSNGGGMWSIYTGRNVCAQFPVKEVWEKLEKILDFNIPYEKLAQTFNAEMGISDVWSDVSFTDEKRLHPAQKPQKLLRRLISASSNPGDNILDPFAGCGSVAVACEALKRNCASIESNESYAGAAKDRLVLSGAKQNPAIHDFGD